MFIQIWNRKSGVLQKYSSLLVNDLNKRVEDVQMQFSHSLFQSRLAILGS